MLVRVSPLTNKASNGCANAFFMRTNASIISSERGLGIAP